MLGKILVRESNMIRVFLYLCVIEMIIYKLIILYDCIRELILN